MHEWDQWCNGGCQNHCHSLVCHVLARHDTGRVTSLAFLEDPPHQEEEHVQETTSCEYPNDRDKLCNRNKLTFALMQLEGWA